MGPLHLIFLLITFNQYNALTITKSATITPNTPNLQDNDGKVTELHAITRTPSKWTLHDGNSAQGFHLKLILNTSWGFHSTENTTLKIEVMADGVTDNFNSLMVAFSQTDSNTYFTTKIFFDPTYDHRIYPPCQYTQPYNQIYLAANVTYVVNAWGDGWSQFYKAATGNVNYLYNPELPAMQRVVSSPLTFIMFNNPNDKYMLYTYTNPNVIDRSCGFVQMDPNKGMDIYFAANSAFSSIDISSFIITHVYDTTEAPTSDPTGIPIMNTVNPTLHPTGNPTIIPTVNPTLHPTRDPIKNPTTEPTKVSTNNPTAIPTINPTMNPTAFPRTLSSMNPSFSSIGTSNTPSYSPTDRSSNIPTEPVNNYTFTTSHVNISNPGDTGNNMQHFIIFGSVCSVLILIIMVLIVMIMWKKRKIIVTKKEKNLSNLQQDKISQNMTQMVVTDKTSDADGNEDDDDLYDEVASIDIIGVTTTTSDGNSLFNVKDVSNDEQDGIMDIEEMYNPAKPTMTATPAYDEGVKHIDDNINPEDAVKDWLNEIVELPQYYDIFVNNGLNSLKLIQKLDHDQQLIDLGIELKAHRIIIIKYIKQLTTEGDCV